MTAIKKQAESTNAEYDRLAEENQKLQVRHKLNLLATQTKQVEEVHWCVLSFPSRIVCKS